VVRWPSEVQKREKSVNDESVYRNKQKKERGREREHTQAQYHNIVKNVDTSEFVKSKAHVMIPKIQNGAADSMMIAEKPVYTPDTRLSAILLNR
jgi:hypothetical protein